MTDLDGEEAVSDEIVELEHVADGHAENGAVRRRNLIPLQRLLRHSRHLSVMGRRIVPAGHIPLTNRACCTTRTHGSSTIRAIP